MSISDLPLEIFQLIRNYLFVVGTVESLSKNFSFPDEKFLIQESKWSWNNFLSMSKQSNWQQIRRHTMIWSLNRLETRKFLTELSFRNYIHDKVEQPGQQIELQLQKLFVADHFPTHVFETNSLLFLSLSGFASVTAKTLPAISNLRGLSLEGNNLSHLNSFPCLRILHLLNFHSINLQPHLDLPSLSTLRVDCNCGISGKTLSLFPLEQLQELSFCTYNTTFLRFLSRCRSLLSLEIIHCGDPSGFRLPKLPLPTLRSLEVHYCDHLDLTGLKELTTLKLDFVKNITVDAINGLPSVFTVLHVKSFDFLLNSLPAGDIPVSELFPVLNTIRSCYTNNSSSSCSNRHLKVLVEAGFNSLNGFSSFQFSSELESLNDVRFVSAFGMINVSGRIVEKRCERISLSSSILIDTARYRNVQSLVLTRCTSFVNLSPLTKIPYVTIRECPAITDFSSFGTQRYLEIENCSNLRNEDVHRFGNIGCLKIKRCDGFNQVTNLMNNRYIEFQSCPRLVELTLPGKDYVKVSVISCSELQVFEVLGNVYSLELTGSRQINVEMRERLLNRCSYIEP
jgi:hypothetical protein